MLANVIFCRRANVTCTRSRELFCSKTTGKVSIGESISHGKHEEIFHDNKILVMQVDLHSHLPGDGSSDTYVMPNFKIDLSEISSVRKCVWFKTENISKKLVKRLYCFSLNIFLTTICFMKEPVDKILYLDYQTNMKNGDFCKHNSQKTWWKAKICVISILIWLFQQIFTPLFT